MFVILRALGIIVANVFKSLFVPKTLSGDNFNFGR
jgi:hypothetical protein